MVKRKKLRDVKKITVTAVQKVVAQITFERCSQTGKRKLLVGGDFVGYTVGGTRYPKDVRVARVSYSDGTYQTLCDHSIVARDSDQEECYEVFDGAYAYKWHIDCIISGWMRVGSIVEKAFHYRKVKFVDYNSWRWGKRWGHKIYDHKWILVLTNDEIHFPLERPQGAAEWNKWGSVHFAIGIKAQNWDEMLRVIEGKFFEEVNSNERVRGEIRKSRVLTKAKSRIDRVVKSGECFDASSFDNVDVSVGIGSRLIFSGRKDGRPIWVVDSPEYGHALFVFTDETPARDFANGRISAADAKELASSRIVHAGDWETRTASALAV